MKSKRHESLQNCVVNIFGGRKEKSIGKEIKIITLFVLSKPEELTRKREMSGRWLRVSLK